MSYKSILLNVDIDGPIGPITRIAIDLAKRSKARLIGFCAADAPLPVTMAPEGAAIAAEVWQQLKDDIQKRFKDIHAEFDGLVAGLVATEWRNMLDNPNHALVVTSRIADLIITGTAQGASTGDSYRTVDPGTLALRAGRPLLIASSGVEHAPTGRIVVAWKDTREARRAVADAVPLMAMADDVIVVTVDSQPDAGTRASLNDVVAFLAGHGIEARTEVLKADDESDKLIDFLSSAKADLIVSGAYGHSRIREWVLGGVTRSLLDDTQLCRFMSS
ncbi:universal stress protein [Mesorhizobium sp. B2-4-11]|uniref:universal stress protein n=1 Tax=Mesorhizobium sp. B2-4-11 TaxID=2589938 RepID=UPI00112BD4BB|nr:universal stress protein [Mesorhizobium sp. B2-4-11]TPL12892.1 universal stress protein [Mesorhizobium sp. B2-4-11]